MSPQKPLPNKSIPKLQQWWWRIICKTEFLCDNCKYDHPSNCTHTARPNAVKCPDYTPKGK